MSEQAKRISRQELYEKIWIAPLKKVAEELETTYAELARVCDELNVPKPAHGHWQRLKRSSYRSVFITRTDARNGRRGNAKPKGLPKNKTIPATDHEMEKPPESTGVGQVDSGSPVTQCESQTIAEKCATSSAPVTKPKIPPTVEYTREQLYRALWNTPCTKLAAKLGVSDMALAKTCRRLGVPRPPRGYWARIEAGEKLPKERLPAAKESQDPVMRFDVTENVARREEWAANNILTAGKSKKPSIIELPPSR